MSYKLHVAKVRAIAVPRTLTNADLLGFGSALFFLSNAIFAEHLSLVAGTAVLIGTVALIGLAITLLRHDKNASLLTDPIQVHRLGTCFAVAGVLFVLGGTGHFFYPSADWLLRDALLGDLVKVSPPLTYAYAGKEFTLRAPIGMYMLPALIGRGFGLPAAHVALFVQNTTLLAVTLYFFWLASGLRTSRFLFLFIAFSGMDALAMGFVYWFNTGTLTLPWHLEGALYRMQYSSHVTLLFWVPNHVLPGWWIATITILCARGQMPLHMLIVMLAGLALWSPLALVGALPLVLLLFAPQVIRLVNDRWFWATCFGSALLLPVAAYLLTDTSTVPSGWHLFKPGIPASIVVFLLYELPHLFLIWILWDHIDRDLKKILAGSIVMLVCLPTYAMGPSNDLLMRGSIVPLAMIAFVFAIQFEKLWSEGRSVALRTAAAAVVAIGAATPLVEIGRSIFKPTFPISACNVLTAWSQVTPEYWMSHYMADRTRTPASLFRGRSDNAAFEIEPMLCWPEHPIEEVRIVLAERSVPH